MADQFKKKTIHLCLQKSVLNGSAIQIRQDALISYLKNTPKETQSCFTFETPKIVSHKSRALVVRFISEIWLGLCCCAKVVFNSADVFFVSSPNYFTSIVISLFILKIKKRKLVYEIRDLYPLVLSSKTFLSDGSIFFKSLNQINNYIISRSDLVITTSPSLKRFIFQNYKVSSERVEVVHNGAVQKNATLLKKSTSVKRFTIICVGNFGQFQSIELISKLAKNLLKYDIDILVVGRFKIPKNFEKTENLKFMSPVFDSEMHQLLAEADMGLSARDQTFISRNSMPMKIYEYMSFGLPLLIFPKSEAGDFAKKQKCGMGFDHEQIDQACEYVLQLKSSKKDLSKASQNALKASEFFDRSKQSKKTVNLLMKCAQKSC